MKAWVIRHICDLNLETQPLAWRDLPAPKPQAREILIRISCCGVCHTELDEIEGRTPPPHLPVVPGHQVIGLVEKKGNEVSQFSVGDRVGVAWIFSSCGTCRWCNAGLENLCKEFQATGRDAPGGYAEFMTVPEMFAYKIPEKIADEEAAPLLCAGAIGYRSLRLTQLTNGQALGLTGFGASGHLVLKMALTQFPDSKIFVFARSKEEQAFARTLGASWAGDTADNPPEKMQAIIDTTPAWQPVLSALENLLPGGRLVINAIRKEAGDQEKLIHLNYAHHLWMEKEIKSVANITSRDVREFLLLASGLHLKPEIEIYPMEKANEALLDLKHKHVRGAKVLKWM
jgi:propanol-preferring alcohol dehydrogenase